MCFGNDTQKLTPVEGNSAVEHLIIHSDGRTNQEEDIQCFCCFFFCLSDNIRYFYCIFV